MELQLIFETFNLKLIRCQCHKIWFFINVPLAKKPDLVERVTGRHDTQHNDIQHNENSE
jgi:hypothetical protein